jgi:beta-lactamase regulating signal transducer with metallopeptidase domain
VIALAAVPVLVGLLLCAFADPLARALRPSLAVPLLTTLALTVALCTGLILSAAAVVVCAQLAPFARLGQWSAPALRSRSGLPEPLGILALIVVVACLAAALRRALHSATTLISAGRAARLMHPLTGELVVVDDDVPTAYSVAGLPGRIVVSTSMLGALTPAERRVLIAHETAHLRHRHHVYVHLSRLAAAANPLLRTSVRAVERAVERWADDAAAAEVGDRTLTAHALARAALARSGQPRPAHPALSAADGQVVARVERLLAPARLQARSPILLIIIAGSLSWAGAAAIALWANNAVQFAETVYAR